MFDDAIRKLHNLQRSLQAIDGQHQVPFTELFNSEFMLRHTDFPSIEDMFESGGFKVEKSEDFAAIPDEVWEEFVVARTRFSSWEKMKSAATKAWVSKKIGMGLE